MPRLALDTHQYVKRLKSVGFTEEQAEVIADEQKRLIEDQLATKSDLNELETRLAYSLTYRFALMLTAAVSILAALNLYG
ncbi:DUF1640 domain-containing protein [Thiomicrospira microaerophila]|uniref:DUF1640 domain-containing protein n=1 Tax=Thiomicrospira microaerophila TaxID=406020 RepID=UPI0005C8874A|nr:DUF1640 domain-containing protein [Thiomicrospira microaerophila]